MHFPSHILLCKEGGRGKGRKRRLQTTQAALLLGVRVENGSKEEGSRDTTKLYLLAQSLLGVRHCQREGREARCNSSPGTRALRIREPKPHTVPLVIVGNRETLTDRTLLVLSVLEFKKQF